MYLKVVKRFKKNIAKLIYSIIEDKQTLTSPNIYFILK